MLCGDSGWDFASILGSAISSVVRRIGIDMSTKLNCPQCRSIETSRSHRRGTVERYLLAVIGVRPFRCLNCDARFYSFARFDEETSLNNKAAWAVYSEESDMIENNWWQLYRDAVFEINRGKVLDRVKAAEDAIRARASLGGQVSNDERISIQDAMAALLVLRRDLVQNPVANIKQRWDVWGKKWVKHKSKFAENVTLKSSQLEESISRWKTERGFVNPVLWGKLPGPGTTGLTKIARGESPTLLHHPNERLWIVGCRNLGRPAAVQLRTDFTRLRLRWTPA
jgi:hypothetical protein